MLVGLGDTGGPRTAHSPPPASRQLQKSKEREEQLEEMIQAYEKLCVEKADLETELGEMVGAGGDRCMGTSGSLPRSVGRAG